MLGYMFWVCSDHHCSYKNCRKNSVYSYWHYVRVAMVSILFDFCSVLADDLIMYADNH